MYLVQTMSTKNDFFVMVVGLIHSDCQWHNRCYSLQGSVETSIAALSETMVGPAVDFNLANAQDKRVLDASL